MFEALSKITSADNNRLILDDEQFKDFFDRLTSTYMNTANLIRIDDEKFENIDGEDDGGGSDFVPSGPMRKKDDSSPSIEINNTNTTSSSEPDTSYADFVADSMDIGLPGTEPNVEEI
jgi:hypothetical protein